MALGPVRLVSTSPLTSSRSPISLLALLICRLSYTTHYASAKLSSPLHIENLREEDEVVKSWRYLEAVLVRRPSPPPCININERWRRVVDPAKTEETGRYHIVRSWSQG